VASRRPDYTRDAREGRTDETVRGWGIPAVTATPVTPEDKLRREGVSGKYEANAVHRDVGAKAPFGRVRSNRFNLEVRPEPRYRSDEI